MQLPAILCGAAKTVAASWRKRVTRLKRGGAWIETTEELLSDRDAPGLVLLNGPSPLLGGEPHVHAYAPFWELGRAIDDGKIETDTAARAFDEVLAYPWSVLGLLSQANYRWLQDDARAERFLLAMRRHWTELDAVGPRYTMGSRTGARLWDLPHLLKFVLARRGVPEAALTVPLPPGGLDALVPAIA